MNTVLFINSEKPDEPRTFNQFRYGCEVLGLPYHYLKQIKGYPKHYKTWTVFKNQIEKNPNRANARKEE